jgi:hypothetical protein
MLTEPNGNWFPILKPHHAMFPITNVITKYLTGDGLTQIEGIEVHVISIHKTTSVVVDNDSA